MTKKFGTGDRLLKIPNFKKNSIWLTASILEVEKSRYLRKGLTDLVGIWYGMQTGLLYVVTLTAIKIEFLKTQHGCQNLNFKNTGAPQWFKQWQQDLTGNTL